jgi:undecaprenyl-diphosphatase
MARKDMWPKLIAAFLPTGIIGFLMYKILKQYLLGNTLITVLALGIGGIIFILLEYFLKKQQQKTIDISSISYKQAITIGFAQSFSIIPGVSRAAASIFGAMLVGLDRQTSVEFSFLLAIPTMVAATGLDIIKSKPMLTGSSLGVLFLGTVVACITAMISIKTFMGYIRHHTFLPFGIYRIIIAILFGIVFLHT